MELNPIFEFQKAWSEIAGNIWGRIVQTLLVVISLVVILLNRIFGTVVNLPEQIFGIGIPSVDVVASFFLFTTILTTVVIFIKTEFMTKGKAVCNSCSSSNIKVIHECFKCKTCNEVNQWGKHNKD